jgi:hypothetical protein
MGAMRRFLLLLASVPLLAQQQAVRVTADCVIGFTFSASGNTPVVSGNPNQGDNRQAGCESWTLQYQSTGFSAVTLTIQSAPGPTTIGSWVTYAGTIDTGINPNTSITGATTTGHNGTVTIPWIRVNAALTGTGILNGVLYGLKSGPSINASFTPSGTQNVNLIEVDGTTANNGGVAGGLGVGGVGATGSATSGNPVLIGGSDGTDTRTLSTDNTGKLNVNSTFTPSGTQDVLLTGSGTFTVGQTAVTGTAAALPTHAANGVCVKALIGNTINVYIGPTGITTSTGFELPPGQGWCGALNNLNAVFVIASTTGASVTWTVTD